MRSSLGTPRITPATAWLACSSRASARSAVPNGSRHFGSTSWAADEEENRMGNFNRWLERDAQRRAEARAARLKKAVKDGVVEGLTEALSGLDEPELAPRFDATDPRLTGNELNARYGVEVFRSRYGGDPVAAGPSSPSAAQEAATKQRTKRIEAVGA